jgi:hypothetical protein
MLQKSLLEKNPRKKDDHKRERREYDEDGFIANDGSQYDDDGELS